MILSRTLLPALGAGLAVLALSLLGRPDLLRAASKVAEANTVPPLKEIRLHGRIVCLAEEMQRLHQTQIPTPHEHLYGFKTNEGVFYTLLRTKTSEALFADKQLLERELIVQGRILPNTLILEATPVGSVRNGKFYDLYYYCTICAIKTIAPGTCPCCQQEVEFVEKPAGD